MKTTIESLKVGDFFTLKDYGNDWPTVKESVVWVKGEYNRFAKAWNCYKFEDTNHEKNLKRGAVVYINFDF